MIVDVPILIKTEQMFSGGHHIVNIQFNTTFELPESYVRFYSGQSKETGIQWVNDGKDVYSGNLLIYDMELFEESIDSLIFNIDFLNKVKQLIKGEQRRQTLNEILK